MELINQQEVYSQCGLKIKSDVMSGNAVVIFAYGLSGSGKTYTVFGPDAVDAPEAWFKHDKPQDLWGIFPRLCYEIFQEKQDGWKISMKYFQNVVDTVRDLMSPSAEEQAYKNGMRKDPDGFMDIEWCLSKVITDWDDLRKQFQIANSRKAIAPTQFNPMSTRGHCIMVLEVEQPHPETEGLKQRGRLYVCDLAGTEPAGDIVSAMYQKVTFDDGTFEYKYQGPHPDTKKTKELQEQGKKINLSLSEMAQFFMKMAEAVKKKQLKPGMAIPGCNSFFLCRYLKDTMLQARTYLFCAIRPEVEYLKYTFATLGFAQNASVVKLAPKKATVAASAAERKLMAELEAMKELVEQLKRQAEYSQSAPVSGAGDADADRVIAELQAKLQAKQENLATGLSGGEEEERRVKQQIDEYARKGITLSEYAEDNQLPYFSNLDEDAFRSNRLMYILKKEAMVFGSKGDFQPPSLSVIRDHCLVKFDGESVTLVPGKGDTYVNGKLMPSGKPTKLDIYDRLAMGDQLMMLRWPGKEDPDARIMTGEEAVEEFQHGILSSRTQQSAEELRAVHKEREDLVKDEQMSAAEYERAMAMVDNTILDLLPKAKATKQIVDLFNRVTMSFDVVLEKGPDKIPKVKVSVTNSDPAYSILIDPAEFLPKLALLKDEMMKIKGALDAGRDYELPERHDPLYLMFDNDFLLGELLLGIFFSIKFDPGTATHWPEYLLFNLETDDEEKMQDIKNACVPYNNVGLLEVSWKPLAGPNEGDELKDVIDIESEDMLLGKSWTYRLSIKRACDLPVVCELAYVEYDFFGETFTTEAVQQTTYSPVFDYTKVHHVPCVTQAFIDFLKGRMEMNIHITQHVKPPPVRHHSIPMNRLTIIV